MAKIENGIPIPEPQPPRKRGGKWITAIREMGVGDSILLERRSQRGSLDFWRRATGFRFTIRTTPEGLRVWRIG